MPADRIASDGFEDQESQDDIAEVQVDVIVVIPDRDTDGEHEKKRHKLAYAVNCCGMADKEVLLHFEIFGGGEGREIGVAKTALQGYGLDGFSAYRARFCIFIHDADKFSAISSPG